MPNPDLRCAVRRGLLGILATAVLGWAGYPSTDPQAQGPAAVAHWRVPLDQAAGADLELLPGVGPTLARRMGEVCGEPTTMRAMDLLRVPRLGPIGRGRIAPWVVFEMPTGARHARGEDTTGVADQADGGADADADAEAGERADPAITVAASR